MTALTEKATEKAELVALLRSDYKARLLVQFLAYDVGERVANFCDFLVQDTDIFQKGVSFENLFQSANDFLIYESHRCLRFEVINGALCVVKDMPMQKGITQLSPDNLDQISQWICEIGLFYENN